jgi:hypothetical protein
MTEVEPKDTYPSAMTLAELKDTYWAAVDCMRESDIAIATFNLQLKIYLKEQRAPSDFNVDLWGDGTIKHKDQCKPHPDPNMKG